MKCSRCSIEFPEAEAQFSSEGNLVCSTCAQAEALKETIASANAEGEVGRAASGALSRIKGALLLGLGVLAFGGGGYNAYAAYTIGSDGTVTEGTVVDLIEHRRRRRSPAYTEAVASVTLDDGRVRECTFSDDEVAIGDTLSLEVAFVDGDLQCERPGSNWKNWSLAGGLLCCVAPIAVLGGFGLMFPGLAKEEEEEKEEEEGARDTDR